MKKYHIENVGLDDSSIFDIELTDEELKIAIKLFEENNKQATCDYQPEVFIYSYDESRKSNYYYDDVKALNRGYKELKEK